MKKKIYSIRWPVGRFAVWKNRQPLLSHLDMELTERCNNNCRHCYINLPENDSLAHDRELPIAEIIGIMNEAASLGCLTVRFTGGEPLLREDFEEIYLHARHLGLRVIIFTNGTLITVRLAKLFYDVPPLEKIVVSVYGLDPSSYETISRIPGSFAGFQKGIALLRRHNIPFEVKASLLPINSRTMQEFEAWAGGIPGMNAPHASVLALYLRCRSGEKKRNDCIRSLRLPPQQLLEVEARNSRAYARDVREFCSRFCAVPGDRLLGCGAGIGKGSVDAYGNLKLCLLLRHPATLYDLKSGSLRDALVNFFPKVREMKAVDPLYEERCARCFLHSLCEQCPAISWMETGRVDGWVEYFCEFTHAQARSIGLLAEGERSWEVADWKARVNKLSEINNEHTEFIV